jgi:hypothetical protein
MLTITLPHRNNLADVVAGRHRSNGELSMKMILLATAFASIGFAAAANAGSVTVNGVTLTQIPAENTKTFDNNPVGSTFGNSITCGTSAGCVGISFETDGNVWQGLNSGISAPPAGDASHYLWGLTSGALVSFDTPVTYFDIYWGSIDAFTTSNGSTRYDNTLFVQTTVNDVTGTDLVDANSLFGGNLNPVVNGFGDQFSANDNQWFRVSLADGGTIGAFLASSTNNAFEFDMPGTPEPSTWVMMALGFAGLGFAGFRRAKPRVAAI